MCVFSRHASESRTQPAILASSLRVSCHCRLTSLRSVKAAIPYQLRQLRQVVRSLPEDASKTLVREFVSPGLLQLSVLRHLGRTDEPVAVGSERCRPSGYWYSTLRPYVASAPSATLATSAPARRRSTLRLRRSFIGRCLAFRHRTWPRLVTNARERRQRYVSCTAFTRTVLYRWCRVLCADDLRLRVVENDRKVRQVQLAHDTRERSSAIAKKRFLHFRSLQ